MIPVSTKALKSYATRWPFKDVKYNAAMTIDNHFSLLQTQLPEATHAIQKMTLFISMYCNFLKIVSRKKVSEGREKQGRWVVHLKIPASRSGDELPKQTERSDEGF
jgi:hypothetical protein